MGIKEAQRRPQQHPHNVHRRPTHSMSRCTADLLGAALAVAVCIAIIWGFSWAYQMGYAASECYHTQEVHKS